VIDFGVSNLYSSYSPC